MAYDGCFAWALDRKIVCDNISVNQPCIFLPISTIHFLSHLKRFHFSLRLSLSNVRCLLDRVVYWKDKCTSTCDSVLLRLPSVHEHLDLPSITPRKSTVHHLDERENQSHIPISRSRILKILDPEYPAFPAGDVQRAGDVSGYGERALRPSPTNMMSCFQNEGQAHNASGLLQCMRTAGRDCGCGGFLCKGMMDGQR